ncbi:MAG TPA: SMP-30/gluconolactonase/LRE family protein [Terracidiphilus sp.]|nr:SMP-30/gluconolactonase/LRE family protein [Terracidiphilus sp.]
MNLIKRFHVLLPFVAVLLCGSLVYRTHAGAIPIRAGGVDSADQKLPLKADRLDPRLDAIVPPNLTMERVANGFKWVEGPVWVKGSLFFAEIPSNRICKWTPGAGVSTFLSPSGYKGAAPYGGPEPGSNGMTLGSQGRLTVAGHAQRDVYRLESLAPDGQITILADTYRGKRLNSPNDLVYRSDGSLYFTDPPYGLRTQKDDDPEKQLKVNGVYRLPHAVDQKAGTPPNRAALQLLVTDLTRPNGIAFSPDEKFLYVNNSEPKKIWMRYRVRPDGSLTDAKLLYDATSDKRPGAPDGMKVDGEGNIYSAGPGGVWIFSPEGKPLGRLLIPEKVSNLAWAGADRKTLYITASSSIYRVHLKIAGAPMIHGQ